MANIAMQAFRNMLMDVLQLAAGCAFPFLLGFLIKKGLKLRVEGRKNRLLAMAASSLAGMLLPVGSFGVVPVLAALWLEGMDLPLLLPLLVSNFLFSMYMPLSYAVFVWSGNIIRIVLAFVLGVLAGLVHSRNGAEAQDVFRKSTFEKLFEGHRGKKNYLLIFKDYIEIAGLYILVAAILRSALSAGVFYWLQGQFLTSGFGLAASTALAKLNVFSPFFGTTLAVLGRLVDFSALASLVFLLKFKSLGKLYAYYIAVALLLAISLFIH
jgi:hypothetical protein